MIEVLIAVAIVAALAAISVTVAKAAKQKAHQSAALQKMKSLGAAFSTYTADKNGLLPFEDAPGTDDWMAAALVESQEAWYNALPRLMGARTVGEIGQKNPADLYRTDYPLFMPGAPYPGPDKRQAKPYFAVAMNSRLQRKNDEGVKKQGRYEQIQEPAKTVILLERGLPGDKKTMPTQGGYDGSPKANAGSFAARHNQKGCLVFADGHAELHAASDLITIGGGVIVPQTGIVWTMNPDQDPN